MNAFSTVAEQGVQQPRNALAYGAEVVSGGDHPRFRSAARNVYGWACPVAGEVCEAVVLPS
ncbi:hypothetical protein ACIBCB_28460 [Streptomyces uncialis]|uniref:hypothetical protein n=1 Tax=Streptomyces uncialis TaxID=1048205 RepID=UPI003791076E